MSANADRSYVAIFLGGLNEDPHPVPADASA